jgi:hypothetical protein
MNTLNTHKSAPREGMWQWPVAVLAFFHSQRDSLVDCVQQPVSQTQVSYDIFLKSTSQVISVLPRGNKEYIMGEPSDTMTGSALRYAEGDGLLNSISSSNRNYRLWRASARIRLDRSRNKVVS